jgi:hypothetical protein
VPQPHRANQAAAVGGGERQPFGRQPALAQPLGRLGEAGVAEGEVEQRFARGNVGETFVADGDHGGSSSRLISDP